MKIRTKFNFKVCVEKSSSVHLFTSKDELIDYANRSGAPEEVIENLQELEDDGEVYESIEDIWPDYPTKDDFFFNEEEY